MDKVLVADDDEVMLKIISGVLGKNNYQAVTAKNGLEAWDILTSQMDIRLAIINWNMPGMDGIEIVRRLHLAYKSHFIHVIFLTARDGAENIAVALEAGANDYITKPFEKDELLARLGVGRRIIKLQQQLTQAQKLEAIGMLASGVSHEINTPIQYISNNINFLHDSFQDIQKLLATFDKVCKLAIANQLDVLLLNELYDIKEEVDMDFLTSEITRAIEESLEGVEHISRITHTMKEFAHPGTLVKKAADINQALENTIAVTHSQWKNIADFQLDLDPELPAVECLAGELNQVFLNIIVNAADAIRDKIGDSPEEKGLITVSTRKKDLQVEICISDNGSGIPDAIREKIFTLFFTTKEVGKGSGQGLPIAYSVITEKHKGSLTYTSEINKGTTFIINLPIEAENQIECDDEINMI